MINYHIKNDAITCQSPYEKKGLEVSVYTLYGCNGITISCPAHYFVVHDEISK